MSSFISTVDAVLRNPSALMERIRGGRDLRELPLQLTAIAALGFAAFGFLLGASHAPLWGLLAAPKLVLVGLGSIAVCLPALHVFGRLMGNESSPLQLVCELLVALATTGLTLVALCPVWIAFARYVNEPPYGYFHVMLGTVGFLGLAGLRGAWVLVRTMRLQRRPVLHLAAWTILYGMVGMQSAWTLRPFVGTPEDTGELVVLRPLEKSAFDASAKLIQSNTRVLLGQEPSREEREPWR